MTTEEKWAYVIEHIDRKHFNICVIRNPMKSSTSKYSQIEIYLKGSRLYYTITKDMLNDIIEYIKTGK